MICEMPLEEEKFASMEERLRTDLRESRWPTEEKSQLVMGRAHLGAIILP